MMCRCGPREKSAITSPAKPAPEEAPDISDLAIALGVQLVGERDTIGFMLLCHEREDPQTFLNLVREFVAHPAGEDFNYVTRLAIDHSRPFAAGNTLDLMFALADAPQDLIVRVLNAYREPRTAEERAEIARCVVIPELLAAAEARARQLVPQDSVALLLAAELLQSELNKIGSRLASLGVVGRHPCLAEFALAQLGEYGYPLHRTLADSPFQSVAELAYEKVGHKFRIFAMRDASLLLWDNRKQRYVVAPNLMQWVASGYRA
jgi:hypothetical protein